MVNITKNKTQFGYEFNISTHGGVFKIFFGGNLDLYWTCFGDKDDLEKELFVTKENYFLFSLFEELYNGILNYEVISIDEFTDFDGNFKDCYDRYVEYKEGLKRSDGFNNNRPFVDGVIEWYSDDRWDDNPSVLRIEKKEDVYKIIFRKGIGGMYSTFAVRFRNSGSSYDPYNVLFMKMYRKLEMYDQDYHQIHMEEYLYDKNRLIREKK